MRRILTSKKDDNRCNLSNHSCSARQPSKQDSSSGPIERTACHSFFASSRPTVVHLFEGSGWYSSTWQTKLIKYIIILLQASLINHTRKLVHYKQSPQICRSVSHHNRRSASCSLLVSCPTRLSSSWWWRPQIAPFEKCSI